MVHQTISFVWRVHTPALLSLWIVQTTAVSLFIPQSNVQPIPVPDTSQNPVQSETTPETIAIKIPASTFVDSSSNSQSQQNDQQSGNKDSSLAISFQENNNYNGEDDGREVKAATYAPYSIFAYSEYSRDFNSQYDNNYGEDYGDGNSQNQQYGVSHSQQDQLYSNQYSWYEGSPSSAGYDWESFLEAHNKHRRDHCVEELYWNENLAQSALNWADKCYFEHSDYGPGENLMYVPNSYIVPEELVDQWVDEKQWYDYNNPYFDESYGHFTQAIWKSTKQVGCASSDCGNFQLVVCHYYPVGNVQGRFYENVPAPCSA